MEKNKRSCTRQFLSLFTAAIILFGTFPSVIAENDTAAISNCDELIEFFKNCRSDKFSKDKKFILENDIDMKGREFDGGEIFCGTFDGKGHTIKNVTLELNKNNGALFGTISENAQIVDLNVKGEITQNMTKEKTLSISSVVDELIKNAGISGISPQENTWITGGIASVNNGHIVNCTMEGKVSGKKTTGGIAGKNSQTGIIESSANYSDISGVQMTGGVAGENYGRIKGSKNAGKINPTAEETTENTGGIAGYNEGVIENSTNNGDIGCAGYGTNTGGISGKQSGCILECVNYGKIGGKKNVGGITGIFIPYSDIEISADKLKEQIEKDKQDIKNDVTDIRDDIKGRIQDIKDGIWPAGGLFGTSDGTQKVLDSISNYIDNASKRADTNSESTNNLKDRLGDAANKIADAAEGASDNINDSLQSSQNDLNDILNDFKNNLDDSSKERNDILRSTSDSINDAISGESNLDRLSDETINTLQDLDSQLSSVTNSLTNTLDRTNDMNDSVLTLLDEATNSLQNGQDNFDEISDSLVDTLDKIDLDSTALDDIADSLNSTSKTLNKAISEIEKDLGGVSDSTTTLLKTINSVISNAAARLEEDQKKLEALRDKLIELVNSIENVIKLIPIPSALPTMPALPELPSVGSAILDMFTTTAYAADDDLSTKLLDDIFDTSAIKEEMKKVISVDIALDRNVAGEYSDNALVQYCCNLGEISGNSNLGGIAGTMGVENLRSNGETITLPDGKPVISDMVMKAVINRCVNDAAVISKYDRCGGIVGNSTIGIIKNCLGAGIIGEEESTYCGAVCGDSNSSILFCIGAAEVNGKSDIGGIAGKGNNIHSTYSISVPSANAERTGAIAGSVDGNIRNNCFIDESIGGIGGTNYENDAEAIPFKDMLGTDRLPDRMDMLFNTDWCVGSNDFPQLRALAENDAVYISDLLKTKSAEYAMSTFKVIFKQEGNVLREVKKDYGETLTNEEIPELQKQHGYYPHWDRDTSKPIIRHTTFNAVYDEATSTIASSEDPPLILIEGIFNEESTVEAKEIEPFGDFGSNYKTTKAYNVRVLPARDQNGNFRVHVYDKNGDGIAIGIRSATGQNIVVNAERDGSYLVCNLNAVNDIVVLEHRIPPLTILYTIGIILLILLIAGVLLFIYVYRFREKVKAFIRSILKKCEEKLDNTAENNSDAENTSFDAKNTSESEQLSIDNKSVVDNENVE